MVNSNAESYVAIVGLLIMGTGWFVDPARGKIQKWLYWCVVPVVVILLLTIAFGSLAGGIGFGVLAVLFLALIHFRYNA